METWQRSSVSPFRRHPAAACEKPARHVGSRVVPQVLILVPAQPDGHLRHTKQCHGDAATFVLRCNLFARLFAQTADFAFQFCTIALTFFHHFYRSRPPPLFSPLHHSLPLCH